VTAVAFRPDHFQYYLLYLLINFLPVQFGPVQVKAWLDNLDYYLLDLAAHHFHFEAMALYL
jgi:hypothetical protein